MATQPLISQWFQKRRGVAMGLSSAGVGAGGLIFSFTTRLALANHGVRISYIINGVLIFAILTFAGCNDWLQLIVSFSFLACASITSICRRVDRTFGFRDCSSFDLLTSPSHRRD